MDFVSLGIRKILIKKEIILKIPHIDHSSNFIKSWCPESNRVTPLAA